MKVFEWILGTSPQNPAGAIDIVAVKREDGSIFCSPFHVKLGTTCKKGEKKPVKILVNGKEVDVSMRLGPVGEAFFLERIKKIMIKDGEEDSESLVLSPSHEIENVFRANDVVQPAEKKRERSYSENHKTALSFPTVVTSEQMTEKRNDVSLSDVAQAKPLPSSEKRDRALSDLTDVAARVTSSQALLPRLLEDDVTTISPNPLVVAAASKPADDDVSWIWRWGYLPVKTSRASKNDLLTSAEYPSEEKTFSSHPIKEMRATADDDVGARRGVEAGKASPKPLPSPAKISSDVGSSSLRPDVVSVAEGKGQWRGGEGRASLEYRQEGERDDVRPPLPRPSLEHVRANYQFTALSLCGELLADVSRDDFPLTKERLLELLYEHRVTSKQLLSLTSSMSILDNPDLVVIMDDFLLSFDVASQLLASVGSNAAVFGFNRRDKSQSPDVTPVLAVNEEVVQRAISAYTMTSATKDDDDSLPELIDISAVDGGALTSGSVFASTSNRSSATSLPCWVGRRISAWNGSNMRQEKEAHELVTSDSLSCSVDYEQHVDLDRSSFDQPASEPVSQSLSTSFQDSDDFEAWKNANVSWQESFSDLLQVYQTEQAMLSDVTASASTTSFTSYLSPAVKKFGRSFEDLLKWKTLTTSSTSPAKKNNDDVIASHDSLPALTSLSLEQSLEGKGIAMTSEKKKDTVRSDVIVEENEGDTDDDHLSLHDVPFDEIDPDPPTDVFYDSDSDSYLSMSADDDDAASSTSLREVSAERAHLSNTRLRRWQRYRYRKTLIPTSDQLRRMQLREGVNDVSFECEGSASVKAQLFLWHEDVKIVLADVEGCVLRATRQSKGFSVWDTFTSSSSHSFSSSSVIEEVVELLTNIARQGYQLLYISQLHHSSQEVFQKIVTKEKKLSLPVGPIFRSPDSLVRAFTAARTDILKAAVLRGVRGLFPTTSLPYHAGFISRSSDAIALERNQFPAGRIYVFNEKTKEVKPLHRNTASLKIADVSSFLHEIFPKILPNPQTAVVMSGTSSLFLIS